MSFSALGSDQALRQAIDAAREEAAQPLSRDEVGQILWDIVHSMEGDMSAGDLKLYNELEALALFIQNTKSEIAAIRPDEIVDRHIPTATDELDAVVGATEKATNNIMDCCDVLSNIAGMEGVPPEVSGQLIDLVTRIFEACNFQDITGQRITKVVKAIEHIEDKVNQLLAAFGDEARRAMAAQEVAEPAPPAEVAKEGDDWLLHGPQLPGNAIDQDEIDRLLASFG
ncbi:MAG TPA: protein phosphatase CheZ [Azospirillaceae bacterium]|nr:protein phosphatase CheZ [Azospirillaceae bacterium]